MLSPLSLSICLAAQTALAAYPLSVPNVPPPGTQTLTGAFQGYSLEMADFDRMAGNTSSPNKLTLRILQNLKDITGRYPNIRIGGTTANHAYWNQSQNEPIVRYYAVQGADQPANVTLGPAYLESFKALPAGTAFTVGLTFDNGTVGEEKTVVEAKAFYEGIGRDSLYTFEIGNEFDVFPVDRNKSTWSIQAWVPQWIQRANAISRALGVRKIFEAGVFITPGLNSNDTTWTAQTALDLGVANSGQARSYSTHQYFGAACRPVKPTLAGDLLNRTILNTYMQYHAGASAYTVSKGIPYILGETNSIACQGLAGVSDVFGAALWAVDYALYAASLNVSGINWHTGIGYRYAAWQAVQNGTTTPGPRPLYYANLMIANAVSTGRQVVQVANDLTLGGYAIYKPASPHMHAVLESIVLVNQAIYNSTAMPSIQRPNLDISLPACLANANVYRLAAAGVEAKAEITFAGKMVDMDGNIVGRTVREVVTDGKVNVKASEAVLISVRDL